MTLQELEADIIRRVFDESFLNEKLLTKLLRAYADEARAQERVRTLHEALDAIAPFYHGDACRGQLRHMIAALPPPEHKP